jgi:N-acetylmuramoyl-L-alanine amidase
VIEIKKLLAADGLANHPSRDMPAITHITIHETGNFNPRATANAHARLQQRGNDGRQASWHYTVDRDEIWQSFRDEQICWHTGTRRGNECSIGIEICVNDKKGYLAACERAASLASLLLARHGLAKAQLVQHHCWSGKNCPQMLRGGLWGLSWEGFLGLLD